MSRLLATFLSMYLLSCASLPQPPDAPPQFEVTTLDLDLPSVPVHIVAEAEVTQVVPGFIEPLVLAAARFMLDTTDGVVLIEIRVMGFDAWSTTIPIAWAVTAPDGGGI